MIDVDIVSFELTDVENHSEPCPKKTHYISNLSKIRLKMSKSFQIRVSSVPKSQTSPAHSAIFCSSCQFGLAQVFGTTRPRAGVALALEAAFALALEPAFALAPDGKMMEK